MQAESYSVYWNKVKEARRKDQPKTELALLRTIAAKAAREKSYGNLLKAQVSAMSVAQIISPDSLVPGVRRIEAMERQASASDAVLAAVYRSVLGTVYAQNSTVLDSAKTKSSVYFKRSLENPDALAKARAAIYEPFVIDGVDSRTFGDDMLHVLGMAAGEHQLLHDYYLAHGNRAAACISALKCMQDKYAGGTMQMQKSKFVQSIDSLIDIYADLPEAGELAIERYSFMEGAEDATPKEKVEYIDYALAKWGSWPRMNVLRNARRRLTLPNFHVSIGEGMSTPDTPRDVLVMSVCNIGELTMTVRRVDIGGDTRLSPDNKKDYAQLKKHIVPAILQKQTRRYIGQPEYQVNNDTMQIKGLPVGVYLAEFTANNADVPVERALLRVSNLYVVTQKLPGKNVRMAVVNATTGMPVPGASIRVTTGRLNGGGTVQTLKCNEQGEAQLTYSSREPSYFHAYTDNDHSSPELAFGGHYSYYGEKRKTDYVKIYTDRRIYRPGQTVRVSVLAYDYNNDGHTSAALARKAMTLSLRNANYKEIATRKVVTDAFGMASAEFVLPDGGLNGVFSIRTDFGNNGHASFSVEEYKRPTFAVEFDKVNVRYSSGDTVSVKGWARSFAGVPVQGARVACTVVRRPSLMWRFSRHAEPTSTILVDTVTTSADGSFVVRVPVVMPESKDTRVNRYYAFDVSAAVTDVAGETRRGEMSLPLSDRPTAFYCDIPERIERDSVKTVVFQYKNNAGESIDGDVTFYIGDTMHTCRANTPVALPVGGMASGRHRFVAYCGTDTIESAVIVFSMDDKKVVVDTRDWYYLTSDRFSTDGSVFVQAGASDSLLHVMYTMLSGDRILESGCIDLHGELLTRELKYKEEYGDGVTLNYAWVKNGRLYRHTSQIERPMPDRRLVMKWTTFRDRLTPGQKEEWTLNVSRPDGTAANAQLMAVLYDKSLDEIRKNTWSFSLPDYLNMPYTSWQGSSLGVASLYGEMPFKPLDTRELRFSRLDISLPLYGLKTVKERLYGSKQVLMVRGVAVEESLADDGAVVENVKMKAAATAGVAGAADNAESQVVYDTVEQTGAAKGAGDGEAGVKGESQPSLRENLNETAFFYPGLTTDEKGDVKLTFTLPESITTWRFMGLAHDKQMNSGMLEGETVAKKTVMVQPNVPRFVRTSDNVIITARVFNTSDHDVSGTATCRLVDPETDKVVGETASKYEIKAGETAAVSFGFDMGKVANDGLLVCRVVASGRGYSDGEQHYLPVMPDKEMVVNTLPFTQNEAGTKTLDIGSLFAVKDKSAKLTVEYTDNPAWLMIQALPSMATPQDDNAISLATAFYANTIGRNIMQKAPVIKTTVQLWKNEGNGGPSLQSSLAKNEELKSLVLSETPWLLDADRETDQKQRLAEFFDESLMDYRLSDAMSKLQRLQNADGSFSWWSGMEGSSHMTLSVAEMFVRLNSMVGSQAKTSSMLSSAFAFLEKKIDLEVKELKKEARKGAKDLHPSDFAITYLYVRALDGRKLSTASKADIDYLIGLIEKQSSIFSIYGKARTAVVMAKNGRTAKASELLQSIKEYTVYKEEMGRYFDTPKAQYSWFDYRIPSQTIAIEALKMLEPDNKQTISEMQRWLLQSKRTQAWSTPLNSVNAVYAFLDGNMGVLSQTDRTPAVIRLDGKKMETPKATAGLGYVKMSTPGGNARTLTVEKSSDGVSWGAAYAQFMQQTDEVKASSAGMTVRRELSIEGRTVTPGSVASLRVGDKVTVRITVEADRDYDFVQVTDRRAACLEPVGQLSGGFWGYYCSPKDNATYYYFDRLAKGKHVVETEYYVDRAGLYHTGTCAAQCAYSPEFAARGAAMTLQVAE